MTWFRSGPAHRFWKGGRSYAFDADLRWDEQRVKAMERDCHQCQFCGRKEPEARLVVHHVRPLDESGDNVLSNLITLCSSCHTHIHMMARKEVG
jgi:5-methylcytosine-specific restriction endonuclease McrA